VAILELGHTGLHVHDLDVMRDFYERVLGLTVTDVDPAQGTVFLSSRPEVEHHEMVLATGRTAPIDAKLINQISWRVDGIEALQHYHRVLTENGAQIERVLDHGNAIGIYFLQPEGDKLEVYWQTGLPMPQPFGKQISLQAASKLCSPSISVWSRAPVPAADQGRFDSAADQNSSN